MKWYQRHWRFLLAGANFSVACSYAFAAISTGEIFNIALSVVWLGLTLMWLYIGYIYRPIQRREMDGHRSDGTHHQGGAVEGTSEAADFIAKAIEGTISMPGEVFAAITGAKQDAGQGTSPPELEVYTAPVWGFRHWSIAQGSLPVLYGYNHYVWKPGKNCATCRGNWDGKKHLASHPPSEHCACGFYALRDCFDVGIYGEQNSILGGVVGWGKIIDGEKGWRAQYASVAAVLDPPVFFEDLMQPTPIMGSSLMSKAEYIAELYNVPLCSSLSELVDKTREMAEWMAGADLADAQEGM